MENRYLLYTTQTEAFVKKCIAFFRNILEREVGCSATNKRFLYRSYYRSYHIVIFESPSGLGYFDGSLMEIGIAKRLLFAEDALLQSVLRHEIAHMLCYLNEGAQPLPHGKSFREMCKKYGWDDSIAAFIPEEVVILQTKRLENKILKLLDLSKSANLHEATGALNKAREMMIAHNIEFPGQREDEYCVIRVLQAKQSSEKLRAIADILRNFFVYPVINHGLHKVYLELFGAPQHLEIAEYVALTLDQKLEELWALETSLKGIRAKNSFFRGIAKGYLEQCPAVAKEKGLMKIEGALIDNIGRAYPHLGSIRRQRTFEKSALEKGKKVGRQLDITKGIKKKFASLLLGYSSSSYC